MVVSGLKRGFTEGGPERRFVVGELGLETLSFVHSRQNSNLGVT